MDRKGLKKKFIFKYISKYFLYGHLFFIGIVLSIACGIIALKLKFPLNLISSLFLVALFVCLNHYIRILSTTKFKWKFYKVYSYRIEKKPFDEDWFCNYMYEPCMRLIIKDLCYEHGYKNEYKRLYDNYSHENHYLETKKSEFIEQVRRKNELMLQGVEK